MGRLPAAAWADAAGLLQGVEEGMADEGVSGPGAAVPLGRRQLGDARQRADGDSFVLARRPVHAAPSHAAVDSRSEEHTSELQSLMRISYAVFCLKTKQMM